MSYVVFRQKPFSGPEDCASGEHYDWETSSCQPGLCPPGSAPDASGNCSQEAACSASEHFDAEAGRCLPGLCPEGLQVGPDGNCVEMSSSRGGAPSDSTAKAVGVGMLAVLPLLFFL